MGEQNELSQIFDGWLMEYRYLWEKLLVEALSQKTINRSWLTNFFLFRCWKHKDIDRWIILAQIMFLLYINFFGNTITTQELGTQYLYNEAWKHSFCHEKLVWMKFSMKKHDISLVAIITRQVGRICWHRDWMFLSSVDCFRMIIRRIQTGLFEDRLDILNWLQCLWNFSILIFVDCANLRAVIAGEQSGWFHTTNSCLASLQRALWKHISRIATRMPFGGLKSHIW